MMGGGDKAIGRDCGNLQSSPAALHDRFPVQAEQQQTPLPLMNGYGGQRLIANPEVTMALSAQGYRDALTHLGHEQPVFIDPPAPFRKWLAEKQLPCDVAEFLVGTALAAHVPFPNGCGGMWTPRDIMVLNDQESDILGGGLLALGTAVNGDFIVMDLHSELRQAGFVGHDELARNYEEARAWRDVREIFVPVAASLDEMLVCMSVALWGYFRGEAPEQSLYPCDYCDALLWQKNK